MVAVSGTHPGYKQGGKSLSLHSRHEDHTPQNTRTHSRLHVALRVFTDTDARSPAQLKALVEGLGATFSSSMSASWTHLVTTQKDVEKTSTKCKLL